MKHLEVSEIFYSIQGESTYAGLPCAFVRLAQCNLNCSYCDSRYSHQPGRMMSQDEIMLALAAFPVKLVEITGGEPMLQDNVIDLMDKLYRAGYMILLETNGSLYLGDVPDHVVKIIDVKTPGSGESDSFMKWNLRFLQPHDQIKFVLTAHHDYRFALDFIREHQLQECILLFSPVTFLLPPVRLAQWMLADGGKARLHLQLHKLIDLK